MPFDGKDFDLEIDVYTLRRRKLVKALRAPLVNWDWRFGIYKDVPGSQCGTAGCAIGYAEMIFGDSIVCTLEDYEGGQFTTQKAARFFGMTEEQSIHSFTVWGYLSDSEREEIDADTARRRVDEVTPAMVADKIEELCGK